MIWISGWPNKRRIFLISSTLKWKKVGKYPFFKFQPCYQHVSFHPVTPLPQGICLHKNVKVTRYFTSPILKCWKWGELIYIFLNFAIFLNFSLLVKSLLTRCIKINYFLLLTSIAKGKMLWKIKILDIPLPLKMPKLSIEQFYPFLFKLFLFTNYTQKNCIYHKGMKNLLDILNRIFSSFLEVNTILLSRGNKNDIHQIGVKQHGWFLISLPEGTIIIGKSHTSRFWVFSWPPYN